MMPIVAENESQNHASYTGASGKIRVRMTHASAINDRVILIHPYSTIINDRSHMVVALTTGASHPTKNP